MLKNIFSSINRFLSLLFGNISWNTPPWINYLHHKAVTRPKAFWGSSLFIIFLIIVSFLGYCWYQSQPQPIRVIAQIKPPKITPNETELIPDSVTIDFGVFSNHEFTARSVAHLNQVGKEIASGIKMTPETKGVWAWESDSRLVFTPEIDWPAGQRYDIQFDKGFFTPGSNMESMHYSFSTLPFEAIIADFKFYQDPIRPDIRQAVAKINFSYPVDVKSLENNITLMWQALDKEKLHLASQHFKYAIDYDQNKRIAYVHSENLPLPSVSRFLDLIVDKGVKPIAGPSVLNEALKANVFIPDKASYFKVSNLSTAIIRNQQDRPEQILNLETTLGLTEAELNKFLHVYLLPKDYPKTLAFDAKPNYEWKDPGEITPEILAQATPMLLQPIATDRDYASLHSFKYQAPTPGYIYVKIDKGMRGFGDYDLANNYTAILKVPAYPQEISFLHQGALLALGTEEKLSVLIRGLNAVKFDFARVLPEDINHLITQTYGDFSHPNFINASFNQDNISQISTEIQRFDTSDPAKTQYTALDLNKYLSVKPNALRPLGLFLLRATGWDADKKYALNVQSKRLILITDLGLIVKDNLDGTHDVFVQSITEGKPVNNASVAVLGKNGIALLTHQTDMSGHVSFPRLSDFQNDQEPVAYLVHHANDVSFIPYKRADRELNYSRFDVGGITSNGENQTALTAYLFSDRGIYRPGETAHIGMIVKQPYALPQPAGVPLVATIIDPRGVTVKNENITLTDIGYLSLDFQSNPTSPTGQYIVNLFIVKDNHPSSLIGSTTINVAEFLPDRMRIAVHLSHEETQGWISPTDLSANVHLVNLYGAPAINHKISGKMRLTPQAVTFKAFPHYTFLDPLLNPNAPPKVFTDTLSDTHTNDQGQAQFPLKLDRFEKATYQLAVFVEGFEAEGGRSVAAQTTALVSPLPYLVGYQSDGDLSYIKQQSDRKVKFIAINPKLKQQALNNIHLQLFKLHPVSTLVKKPDGTYQYQSLIQTTKISSNDFAINEQGTEYQLPTQEMGDFLVAIVDEQGTELSRFKYSVVGISQQPLPKNAELNVKLNKTEFQPGEDIEMQITAPYTGAGLITIERDKTYAYQWFKTDTTASVQKIHIPNDFQGNGYVNIAFVRDINSSEIFMSPLSYSVVPFSVSHQNREINVNLTVPSLARPGEPFPITYSTDKPSKIIVFAVDEGVLQVAHYESPDPLKFFFQKHALQVNTLQIVDQILPRFLAYRELSSIGGDDGEEALRRHLNPFKRKMEAPIVFWSEIIDADATPRTLTYQVPDYFNGTLQIMAVAASLDAVGAATKSSIVRGPFVINPNVPTFVSPGDEFDITASIANNVEGSSKEASIAVNLLLSPHLEIIGADHQTIQIPQGEERSVHFRVRAKSLLGSAEITFVTKLNDKTSSMTSTLSVRPASPYYTSIISGYSKDASKVIKLDRVLFPEYRKVEAVLSPSPLILATGMQRYLENYPYGCTEQLVSKAFPLLAMANQPWFINDAQTINDAIQKTIQMLSQRQMSNGGFSYWPDVANLPSNDFTSVYAMHFLTEAKALGYNVPSDVFSAGIGFLKDFSTQDINTLEQARTQAYAIYLLTRNEIVTTNLLTHLQLDLDRNPTFKWQKDITSVYIAATYQLLKSNAEAIKMLQYFKPQAKVAENSDFYNTAIADAIYVYLLAKHFPEEAQKIDFNFILSLVNALNNDSINTILSSYTSLALAAYGQFYTLHSSTLSISEILQDGKQQGLSAANNLYQISELNPNAKSVAFTNPDKQGYFYQLIQAGFDKNLAKQSSNQGIEVYREFRDSEGNTISNTTLGNEIIVHLRARSTNQQYQYNVAIVDLLPGGFEVVRDSIKSQNMDYADIREDRAIFFVNLGPDSTEITYRIKATNTGQFTVPPLFATSMYNPLIKSLGIASSMTVTGSS